MTSDVARSIRRITNKQVNVSYSNLLNQLNDSQMSEDTSRGIALKMEKFTGEIQGKNIRSPHTTNRKLIKKLT